MPRPRTSILNDLAVLSDAVARSSSAAEVLRLLNLRAAGGNYTALKQACARFQLQLPTYDRTASAATARSMAMVPWNKIFRRNSTYLNRNRIKRLLIESRIVLNECSRCSLPPLWNGEPLTLQLDHVNGIYNDNRVKNLRLLCPNCHTQTPGYAGRKLRGTIRLPR